MLFKVLFDGYAIVDAADEEQAADKILLCDEYLAREINEIETRISNQEELDEIITFEEE